MENLHQYAVFAAPLIAVCITFVLNKYLQNKPRLIVYWGHISSHKMPLNSEYIVHALLFQIKPNKAILDSKFRNKAPIIIKNADEIWIYGVDENGNTQLAQSENKGLYKAIEFKEEATPVYKVTEDIYDDILSSSAHRPKMFINTHSIVIRNSGRLPAHDVRIGHKILPDYNPIPNTNLQVTDLPGGNKELLIPIMIPGEQLTISYMYFSPMTYNDVNTYVKSDEGFAKWITVIPAPNLELWQKILVFIVIFVGGSALIYMGILLTVAIYRCLTCS